MTVGAGGYTSSGDPKVKAGFDVIMTQPISRYAKGGKNSRKRWLYYLKKVKEK